MTHLSRAVITGAVSLLGFMSAPCLRAAGETPAAPAASSEASLWTTDFDAALKTAASTNKLLLVDFTGSDWCGWCIKLDEEVFSKPEFISAAPKSYVLVKLDFPRKKELPAAEKKRNDELSQKYEIQGFPSILLIDAEGKVVGRTGYQPGGPEKYVAHLADLAQRPALLAKARQAKGADQARQLAAVLAELSPEEAAQEYPQEVAAIIANDPDNALGLKDKYASAVAKADLDKKLQQLFKKKDFVGMAAVVDAHIAQFKPKGEELAQLIATKIQFRLMSADFDGAQALVAEVVAAAPESRYAKMVPKMIESARQRAEAAKQKAADKVPAPAAK